MKTKPSKDQIELLGPTQHYCGSGESTQRRNGIEEEAYFWNNLWWSGKNIDFCLHSKFTLSKNVWSIFVYSFLIAFLKKKIILSMKSLKKYLIMIVKGHTIFILNCSMSFNKKLLIIIIFFSGKIFQWQNWLIIFPLLSIRMRYSSFVLTYKPHIIQFVTVLLLKHTLACFIRSTNFRNAWNFALKFLL